MLPLARVQIATYSVGCPIARANSWSSSPAAAAAGRTSCSKVSTNGWHDSGFTPKVWAMATEPGAADAGRIGGVGEHGKDSIILSI